MQIEECEPEESHRELSYINNQLLKDTQLIIYIKVIASTLSILKVNNVKFVTLVLRDSKRSWQSSERLPPAGDGNK